MLVCMKLGVIADGSFKGEVHTKMKVSYLVVFGALSRMVKVRGACDKPLWVCKRLSKLRRPRAGKLMTFQW